MPNDPYEKYKKYQGGILGNNLTSGLLGNPNFLIGANIGGEEETLGYYYKGGWPINLKSNEIEDPGFSLPCPGPIGCECRTNVDCDNQNCSSHPKGNFCVPKAGDLLPRFEALDQFGESGVTSKGTGQVREWSYRQDSERMWSIMNGVAKQLVRTVQVV